MWKPKAMGWLSASLVLIFLSNIKYSCGRTNGGYLITTPNRFIPGRPATVCIEIYRSYGRAEIVQLELFQIWLNRSWNPLPAGVSNNSVASSSVTVQPTDGTVCTTITYPKQRGLSRLPDELRLNVSGSGGFIFKDSKRIAVTPSSMSPELTFIQTDKPVYRAGQLVQFRVMTVDTELKPLKTVVSAMYIETPGKVRIEQWNNVNILTGLSQFTFQLSDEPELGVYTIALEKNGQTEKETTTFKVEEYVLPKYEVTLTPPKFVTFQTETIKAEVCAKYTYGQPVLGTAEGSVCIKTNQWSHRGATSRCVAINSQLKDGCYNISVSGNDLGLNLFTQYDWGTDLEITAKVREQGTGVYLDAKNATLTFQQYDFSVNIEGPDKFKPGLAYKGKVVVQKLDGVPLGEESIEIRISNWGTYRSYNKTYISDKNGIIKFSLPPAAGDLSSFSIQAQSLRKYFSRNGPSGYHYVQGWYSPSGSFLQIEPATDTLNCPSTQTFKVMYTTSVKLSTTLHYKVVGVGDIADKGSVQITLSPQTKVDEPDQDGWDTTVQYPCFYYWWRCEPVVVNQPVTERSPVATHKGSFTLSININAKMSTSGKLLIHYVRPDNEVVAESITFNVQPCTANTADMKFSKTESKPGETVGLSFKASPSSVCSYGVVDKSVFLQGGNNQLTLAQTLEKIQQFALTLYSGVWESVNDRCTKTLRENGNFNFWYTVKFQDASNGFLASGLSAITNLKLYSSPCERRQRLFFTNGLAIAGVAGAAGVPESVEAAPAPPAARSEPTISRTIRTYFPETWLWDLVTTDGSGNFYVQKKVPDTITQWIGNAVCLNPSDGLGVSAPAALTVFQPFFVSMNLPYSVVREERMPLAVTVFNYLSECMAVRITVNKLPEFTVDGQSTSTKCACGQQSVTDTFTLKMLTLGNTNVSVTAEVVNSPSTCQPGSRMTNLVGTSDTEIRPVLVKPEGAPREYTVSDFICITAPGGTSSAVSLTNYSLPLPDSSVLIEGSERAYAKVVGDVMGPALRNLGRLLTIPYGCAEQTTSSFVPNIFVLKYLQAISKETSDDKERAIQNMKLGYQRILTFAHPDQSYGAFGLSSTGSLWLTAFIVKCLALSQPYIFIDQNIQSKSLTFLRNNQDSNGCFPLAGFVHSQYLSGGLGNTNNRAGITAFVSIAMMEAGVSKQDQSLVNAFKCIDGQTYTDGYTTAIVAYAYSLYQPTSAQALAIYNKLNALMKKEKGLNFWKANENIPAPAYGRWWWYRPISADTETTGYALLAVIKMESANSDKISKGLPIVRWLSSQRTEYGGFGSTQDTVVGLEALSAFAGLIYSSGISAAVTVSEKASNTQVASFAVNSGNSLVELTRKLPRVTDLVVRASGTGCFLFQANVKYNINAPDTERQAFVTTVEVFRRQNAANPCTMKSIKICTKYVGEGGVSNMAIVQVGMVSGWNADKSSLEKLKGDTNVKLRKYEIDRDGTAQLYFDELDGTLKCFSIDVDQAYNVLNAKPANVITYDYYKGERRQEVKYEITTC